MIKLNKNKLSGQKFFSLEEISNLLEDEKENIGKYIQEGYLKIGKDLKVHRKDLLSLIEHIHNNPQNNKSKVTIKGASTLLWVTTVLLFVLSMNNINSPDNNYPLFLGGLVWTNIILGIIAFIIMFFASLVNTKDKVANHNLNPIVKYSPLLIVLYFVFYFSAFSINHRGLIASQIDYQPQPTPFVAKTEVPTPTSTPMVTSKPIPKKVQPVYVDPDPIIDCESSYPNCKGSSIKGHQSQCSKITCCQVGNIWSVFPTVEKCTEAQKNIQPQQVAAPPTTQRTQGNNTYCWDNASSYGYYTSSGDQCNLDNAKSLTYKICMGTQKMKSDSCSSTCKNKENEDNTACAWAYTGANAGIVQSSDKYGECLNGPGGTGEAYGTCLGKCTDQYIQDIKQCMF